MYIVYYYEENTLLARVYDQHGSLLHEIASYDINGIPREIIYQPKYLFKFIQNSQNNLIPLSDGSVRLAIHPRLYGGGWKSLGFSAGMIVGGILCIGTGPIGVVISGTLMKAGMKGAIYAYKHPKEDFSNEYFAETGKAAITGLISTGFGVAGVAVGAHVSSWLVGSAIGGAGGGISRFVEAKIAGEDVSPKEIIIEAIINAIATGIATKSRIELNQTNSLSKEVTTSAIPAEDINISNTQSVSQEMNIQKLDLTPSTATKLLETTENKNLIWNNRAIVSVREIASSLANELAHDSKEKDNLLREAKAIITELNNQINIQNDEKNDLKNKLKEQKEDCNIRTEIDNHNTDLIKKLVKQVEKGGYSPKLFQNTNTSSGPNFGGNTLQFRSSTNANTSKNQQNTENINSTKFKIS